MRKDDFRSKRIVDLDTIDEHYGVIGLGATNSYLRDGSDGPLTTHRDSWHCSQRIGDETDLALLEFGAGKNTDGRTSVRQRGLGTAAADDHLLQRRDR